MVKETPKIVVLEIDAHRSYDAGDVPRYYSTLTLAELRDKIAEAINDYGPDALVVTHDGLSRTRGLYAFGAVADVGLLREAV